MLKIAFVFTAPRYPRSLPVDETYIKVKGEWKYLYGTVDVGWQDSEFYVERQKGLFFITASINNFGIIRN